MIGTRLVEAVDITTKSSGGIPGRERFVAINEKVLFVYKACGNPIGF